MQRRSQLSQHLLKRIRGVCLGWDSSIAGPRPSWIFGAAQCYVHVQLSHLQQVWAETCLHGHVEGQWFPLPQPAAA